MPIAGTLVVRPAVSADFNAWKPMWDGYNAFYRRQPDEDITRTTWARFSDPAEPMHALVAEQDSTLVGLVHYLFHRSTSMIGPTCYLQDLFTSEALRGRGIGRGGRCRRKANQQDYQKRRNPAPAGVRQHAHEIHGLHGGEFAAAILISFLIALMRSVIPLSRRCPWHPGGTRSPRLSRTLCPPFHRGLETESAKAGCPLGLQHDVAMDR